MNIIMPIIFCVIVGVLVAAFIRYKASDGGMTFGDALLSIATAIGSTAAAWFAGLFQHFTG